MLPIRIIIRRCIVLWHSILAKAFQIPSYGVIGILGIFLIWFTWTMSVSQVESEMREAEWAKEKAQRMDVSKSLIPSIPKVMAGMFPKMTKVVFQNILVIRNTSIHSNFYFQYNLQYLTHPTFVRSCIFIHNLLH